jgi:hypothetical protein
MASVSRAMALIWSSASSRARTICEKPTAARKRGLLGRADVGLRAGVQLDRRQVEFEQTHVLDDQRIGADLVQLPRQLPRRFQFVIAQQGVERNQDLRVVAVRMLDEAADVGDRIAGTARAPNAGPPM